MSDLIKILKAEHANIGKILGMVAEAGIDTDEGRRHLEAAKAGLLAHLAREDEHLYPALFEAAKDDSIVADALEFFEDDIAAVSALALDFFGKYEEDGPGGDFAADFAELAHGLGQRIQKEEAIIYKMYDQL